MQHRFEAVESLQGGYVWRCLAPPETPILSVLTTGKIWRSPAPPQRIVTDISSEQSLLRLGVFTVPPTRLSANPLRLNSSKAFSLQLFCNGYPYHDFHASSVWRNVSVCLVAPGWVVSYILHVPRGCIKTCFHLPSVSPSATLRISFSELVKETGQNH